MQQSKTFDFIVVGSGIAGLHTALTLAPFGNVLIVTKKKLTDAATAYAQGGIAAVTKKDDSIRSHTEDTLKAGYQHNKKASVELLVKGGAAAIAELIQLGVPFDKQKNGEYVTSYEAAHSYPRILHATDFTGREIEKVLIAAVCQNKAIEIWEDAIAVDLIIKENRCFGIQVLKQNAIIKLFSRAVVLATGGTGQLYQWTTNPSVATGDGIAIAHRARAKITDLEFIQFHPTALKEYASPLLLLSEALRGEGAFLVNAQQERFMQKIHPQAELAPRDVVTRAIFHEEKNGAVFLDIRHKKKAFLLKRFPNLYRELQKRGFDLASEQIPVTPAAHFMCGGIATDLFGRTTIKNLFAYGEVAATGVHGANRLASNSLLEGMVFSNQIQYCIDELPQKSHVIARSETTRPHKVDSPLVGKQSQIREIMWQYVGIVRTPQGLAIAKKKLLAMQQEIKKSKGLNSTLLEIKNMLTVGLLIISAAQKRRKSLGTHYLHED